MTSDCHTHQASAEGDVLRAKLREAEARLEGARKRHAEEVAGLEASATHELTLEKQAANRTVTQLQTQLSQMTARAERAEAQLSSFERQLVDAMAESTRQRMAAHEANVRAQQVERAASGMQQAAESAMKRADACEAEAREILATALSSQDKIAPPRSPEEMSERIKSVIGIWKDQMGGKTTDQIMQELRGDD